MTSAGTRITSADTRFTSADTRFTSAGIRLARSAAITGDPGPQPLRYASVNGRQFFAMVSAWPELAPRSRVTGIYHAAGSREKAQIKAMGRYLVVQHGFDVLKPAAMIFEHVPFGPLAQLAITLGCEGPFWSIEADELAGPAATLQALEDLVEGRCDQAIVAGFDFDPPAARAFLLVRDGAADLAWHARFTHGIWGSPDPADLEAIGSALGGPVTVLVGDLGDLHGLGVTARAFEQTPPGQVAVVWRRVPDGRGMLLGVRAR